MPAPGYVIARQLRRPWVDDEGEAFQARIDGLYDAQAGVMGTSKGRILNALEGDRPLIIGARGHAVVLTRPDYLRGPAGPIIQAGGAFDPWPGRGARGPANDELVPVHQGGSLNFVVGIQVA